MKFGGVSHESNMDHTNPIDHHVPPVAMGEMVAITAALAVFAQRLFLSKRVSVDARNGT
jgi:hypothetical protein